MKPLIVLIFGFLISFAAIKILKQEYKLNLAARIAMTLMLIFTAIGHFVFTKGMAMMIPKFIPFKISLIYITGIFEIIIAIGLLFENLKTTFGWTLIIFLVLMLPANIYAALNNVSYQEATYNGSGISYLWFRIPLQLLFIIWTYFSCFKNYTFKY